VPKHAYGVPVLILLYETARQLAEEGVVGEVERGSSHQLSESGRWVQAAKLRERYRGGVRESMRMGEGKGRQDGITRSLASPQLS
jgi:hypothetical protein